MPGDDTPSERGGIDLDEFGRRYLAGLRAYYRAVSLQVDPDDVVQEVMLRARKHSHRFDTDTRLLAWCHVVGVNLIRAHIGTTYQRRESPHADPHGAIGQRPHHIDAETVAIDRIDLARVLDDLSDSHRSVLLDVRDGHKIEEIAAARGISYPAAKQLIHRARIAAKKALGKATPGIAWPLFRFRRVGDAAAPALTTQAAVIAGVAALSIVAALTNPPGSARALDKRPDAPRRDSRSAGTGAAAPRPILDPVDVAPRRPHGPPVIARPTDPPYDGDVAVPQVPGTCAPRLCVGDVPPNTHGDTLYVKPLGGDGPEVTQQYTPTCQHVPDNPGVGCRRDGAPEWLVEPPPPPVPEGEPA